MPQSKHIYLSVFTDRQELSLCYCFKLQLESILGRKLECLGEKLPSPSRLNPGWQVSTASNLLDSSMFDVP